MKQCTFMTIRKTTKPIYTVDEAKVHLSTTFKVTNYVCFIMAIVILFRFSSVHHSENDQQKMAGSIALLGSIALMTQMGREGVRHESGCLLIPITAAVCVLTCIFALFMGTSIVMIISNLGALFISKHEHYDKLMREIGLSALLGFLAFVGYLCTAPVMTACTVVHRHLTEKRKAALRSPLLQA